MWELDYKERWGQRIDAFTLWCWRRLLRVPRTARRTNQSILKEISPEYTVLKDRCWSWNSNILVTWCKELTHLKRPWCWDWQKAGGEGDSRGWDGWMASVTQWTWVWVGSRSWWWAGTPGMLQSMELQRITHNLAIEHKFFRQLGGRSNFFQCVLDHDCFQLKIICMPETLWGGEFCPPYRDSKSLFLVSHISLSQLL